MRTVSVRSADLPKVTIPIGYVGENLYTKVIIDCKKDFDEHPDAVVGMTVEPPEGDAYPAIVTRDGDFVVWDVSASDLVYRGSGSIQISFTIDGTIVGKTPVGRIMVNKSIVPDGEAPTALDDFLTRASTILNEIPDDIDDALEEAKASGEFDGPPGEDGVSPTVTIQDITGGHRITITDAEGPHSFDVMDGQGGGAAIDDESTAADKVWSAQKVNGVKNTAEGKYSKPSDGIPSSDMAEAVRTSLGKADTAYQKPVSGIPGTDLAAGVIPDPTSIIDDTSEAENKVWSAEKSTSLLSAIVQKQDAPATTGTVGQVLGLDSNLDPVWKDVNIDPEDIAEAVDAWLDDHPEATTTVEDGSITKAKLHSDVAERIDEVDELYEIVDPQEKVITSKNLNVTPYTSTTQSGCTITINDDNTASLSGDPTGNIWYPDVSQNKDKRWKLPKGQYTLSGGIDAWKCVTLFLYVNQQDSTAAKEYTCGGNDGQPITFETDQDYWATTRFFLNGNNGELTGYTLKPQIESGDIATPYQSPWYTKTIKTSTFTPIEEELEKIKEVLPFSRSGNLVQYKPVKGESVSKRIDFESVGGFSTITFTHCGENLVPIDKTLEGRTFSKNGISGQVKDGYVLATGTNTSDGWTELTNYSYHARNYWLPAGHYALGCGGIGTMNQASVSVNVNNAFVKTEPWKMIQFYESIRGGHTVDIKDPIILCAGDKIPKEYKPFEGETVTVTLPETVYGGWIDIDNSILHVTKTLSGGSLVPTEEETYDLDPIVLTEIDGINTLYSIDGVVSASGEREESAVINFEEPVRDCYLNNGYLQSKIDRINELAESNIKNGDLFFIITDCHAENNRLYSVPLIREIGRKCNVKNLFDLGDNSDGIYSKTHELVQGLNNSVTGQTHFVYGNHEYMLASENKLDFLYSFGKQEQVGNFARNYYYIDNPQMKMRYIILNGYIENNGSWGHGYEQTQLTWLQNTALNVESGWGIIVFTHNTFTINWETGLVTGYDGTNTQSMLNVLDAYSGNGEIIAVFSGHMHIDAVEHTTGGIPVILTTCDKSQPYMSNGHADFDSSVRIINTISETAFDVVSVDRTNREIHCVRIGCPALNLVDDVTDGYVEERVIPFKS